MKSNTIHFEDAVFHYYTYGEGPRLVFCFHGYGRDGNAFALLETALRQQCTLVAMDLPHHGFTKWRGKQPLQPGKLVQVVLAIGRQLGYDGQPFTLLGFSMGGRIALHLAQVASPLVERLVLIAPDGFTFHFWQWLCTHTWPGRWLLKSIVQRGDWVLKLVKFAGRTGMVNQTVAGFAFYYLHDAHQRQTLYQRWMCLRRFKVHKNVLRRAIARQQVPVRMLFGRHDQMIRWQPGQRFAGTLPRHVQVTIVPETHYLLRQKHIPIIVQLLIGE